jgi:hypothetical protein
MTRKQKVLAGTVAAALIVLYCLVAAFPAGSGGGLGSAQHGIVGWLGSRIGQPPDAPPADLSSTCLRDKTFTVAGSCVLDVAKSSRGTRRVRLRADQAVSVTAPAPQGAGTVTADVKAGADTSVTVDGSGARITLACPSANPCTVRLP